MATVAVGRLSRAVWSGLETENFLGLNELRQRALDDKKPFDYDREIAGIRALDRYTVRFSVKEPTVEVIDLLAVHGQQGKAGMQLLAAVARPPPTLFFAVSSKTTMAAPTSRPSR